MYSLLLSLVIFSPVFAAPSVSKSVTISAGTVQGKACTRTDTDAFLNIPYAQPPIDDLRFASPVAYSSKYPSGVYNATVPGSACIQFGTSFLEFGPVSEDCLHLDIWSPSNATSTSGLPVKVWIYGGGEQSGGISNLLYDGCNSTKANSIIVSINYRLRPLGFLALESAGIGGNFGIQDLILGLEWVQANIVAFGGDPKKVVLFGQSAGATNAFIISSLPQATSLISAAISESGAGRDIATSAVVQSVGAAYAASINCSVTDISCFRSKSTTALNATSPSIPGTRIYSSLNPGTLQPFVDGKTIPYQPSAVGSKVPTIYGSNTMEGSIFVLSQFGSPQLNSTQYSQFLSQNFGPAAATVNQTFPLSAFSASPFPAFTAMSLIIAQVSYLCPAHRALKLSAQSRIPAFTYLWNHTSSCAWIPQLPPNNPLVLQLVGSTHTAEIPFVFGNLDKFPLPGGNCSFTNGEKEVSGYIVDTWTEMGRSGNPGEQWTAWDEVKSVGLVYSEDVNFTKVDYSVCEFWDQLDTKLLNFTGTATNGSTGNNPNTSTSTSSGSSSGTATGTGTNSGGSTTPTSGAGSIGDSAGTMGGIIAVAAMVIVGLMSLQI